MKITRQFLDEVSADCGPSFYLVDTERFKQNFSNLTSAFRNHYPKTVIAYSYKTNYIPRFCEIVAELGGYAEVVSGMEMTLALKLGVDATEIFFNGPYKQHQHVLSLLKAGGTVNVDSWEELQRIACSAKNHTGDPFKLGLRCNFDVYDGILSRFGFDTESREFKDALSLIDEHPMLELTGLHCHFATRSLECWSNRTKGMLAVVDDHFRHRLKCLKHVSLGGGMYGTMPEELKKQFSNKVPTFQQYAEVAALPFSQYFSSIDEKDRPTLIIEPGTALVADSMKYICQVNSIKKVRGRYIASLTGSTYNINPNPNRKNMPIECFPDLESENKILINDGYLSGYTCIEGDYLYKGFDGLLGVGDFIAFDDVGSYSVVMKPPFILPNVAIIEPLPPKNNWRTLKRAETFDDVFSTYNINP